MHPINPPSTTTTHTPPLSPSLPPPLLSLNPLYITNSIHGGRLISGMGNIVSGKSSGEGVPYSSNPPLVLASLSSDSIVGYAQQLSNKIVWEGSGGGGGMMGQSAGGGGPLSTPSAALSDPPTFKLVPLRRKFSAAKPPSAVGGGGSTIKASQKSNYDSDSSDETVRTTAR